jgi:hypothetical protein
LFVLAALSSPLPLTKGKTKKPYEESQLDAGGEVSRRSQGSQVQEYLIERLLGRIGKT